MVSHQKCCHTGAGINGFYLSLTTFVVGRHKCGKLPRMSSLRSWFLPKSDDLRGRASQMWSRNGTVNPILNHHMNSVGYGIGGYTCEGSSALNNIYHEGRRLTRPSSDLELENGGLGHRCYPRRVVVAHRVGCVCQAIAGGAPFIMCCSFFELLKLPKKSCSAIIQFELSRKELGASVPTQVKQLSAEFAPESPSRSWKLNFTELEKRYSAHSSPYSLFEDELSPENVLVRHDFAHRAELPLEGDPTMLLDSSQNNHAYTTSPKDVVKKIGRRK
ncbi:hypothetical protein BC332_13312 [Capsicum chinense]|nr:hypothetical protein BC332_13312 [Capsicum chinense]